MRLKITLITNEDKVEDADENRVNRVVAELTFHTIDDEIYDWYVYEKNMPVTEDARKEYFILKLKKFIASLKERFKG
jgi:hypothetical protein